MSQRTALIVAAALTAFMLVVIGAIGGSIVTKPAIGSNTTTVQPAVHPQLAAAPQQTTDWQTAVSPGMAGQIAINSARGATLLRTPELVSFQGVVAYEALLDRGVVYVDANNGRVLYNGAGQNSTARSGAHKKHDEDDDD